MFYSLVARLSGSPAGQPSRLPPLHFVRRAIAGNIFPRSLVRPMGSLYSSFLGDWHPLHVFVVLLRRNADVCAPCAVRFVCRYRDRVRKIWDHFMPKVNHIALI